MEKSQEQKFIASDELNNIEIIGIYDLNKNSKTDRRSL